MEFCPEIAIFQSAFQLVQNKAGKTLKTVPKTDCAEYVLILKTSVEEICQGLESDCEPEEWFQWQQNIHTLVLYALVKSFYRECEKKDGVPVCSSMDMLVAVFPEFSNHLYFELMKACCWEELLINCLPYLETSISVHLLQDLIQHCMQEPVIEGDCKIMNIIRETILAKLLSVPFELDILLEKQLKPLSKQERFIQLPTENIDEFVNVDLQESANDSETVRQEVKPQAVDPVIDTSALTEELMKKDDFVSLGDTLGNKDDNSKTSVDNVSSQQSNKEDTDYLQGSDKGSILEDSYLIDDKLLWNQFLCENSLCLTDCLAFTEDQLTKSGSVIDHVQYLAQLALVGFLKTAKTTTDPHYKWFLFNLYYPESTFFTDPLSEMIPVYVINMPIADQVKTQITMEKWLNCVHKVLETKTQPVDSIVLSDDIAKSDLHSEEVNEVSAGLTGDGLDIINKDSVQVAAGLCLRADVLKRMIQGCLNKLEKDSENYISKQLKQCQDMVTTQLQTERLKLNSELVLDSEKAPQKEIIIEEAESAELCVKEAACTEMNSSADFKDADNDSDKHILSVKYGDTCWSDVTLEALCWRIQHRLPYSQECVEKLLEPHNKEFWCNKRVYDTFSENSRMLMLKDRVMKLLNILKNLESAPGEVILKAQELAITAFTGLSFFDQDTIAMEMYLKGESLRDYLGLDDLQTMTTFNRITALRDDQILSELFVLCLCDPQDVVSTAVKMSVRNKEQATNFAQVLQFFPNICRTSHPTHHPDSTLLGHVIKEYLLTTNLTDKEQKTFLVFLSALLKVPSHDKKLPLLSPLELVCLIIVPFISVKWLHSDEPITCKFALTVLKSVLESGCHKDCDWTEFEPVALLVCLTELLQECAIFWDGDEEMSGLTKITVKGLVVDCLRQMNKILQDGTMVSSGKSVEWFMHCLSNFDLPVLLQLHEIMTTLGLEQEAIQKLYCDLDSNIASILLIASVNTEEQSLMTVHKSSGLVDYDELIVSMIQILPNLLSSEFENTVRYVMLLVDRELLPVPYRVGDTLQLPLTDFKDFKAEVCVSQILRDVIITLGFFTDRSDILRHTLKCYTACIKSIISLPVSTKVEVKVFIQSQVFHHVCDIVQYLPEQSLEPVLVLLLHMLTSYTDTLASCESVINKHKWKRRMVDNTNHSILMDVDCLPDILVEKEMLLKKIQKV